MSLLTAVSICLRHYVLSIYFQIKPRTNSCMIAIYALIRLRGCEERFLVVVRGCDQFMHWSAAWLWNQYWSFGVVRKGLILYSFLPHPPTCQKKKDNSLVLGHKD